MPDPGYLSHQSQVVETYSPLGTVARYDGTINSNTFGSVLGGAIVHTHLLSELNSVYVAALLAGTVSSAEVIGFGKGLGTMYGTIYGTIQPDSNNVLLKAFIGGTMGNTEMTWGDYIRGTLLLAEIGV